MMVETQLNLGTMWKASIKYDRKEIVFSNKPGDVEVTPVFQV